MAETQQLISKVCELSHNAELRLLKILTCGVCGKVQSKPLQLQTCVHSFCSSCAKESLKLNKECPVCKIAAGIKHLRPVPELERLITAYHDLKSCNGKRNCAKYTSGSLALASNIFSPCNKENVDEIEYVPTKEAPTGQHEVAESMTVLAEINTNLPMDLNHPIDSSKVQLHVEEEVVLIQDDNTMELDAFYDENYDCATPDSHSSKIDEEEQQYAQPSNQCDFDIGNLIADAAMEEVDDEDSDSVENSQDDFYGDDGMDYSQRPMSEMVIDNYKSDECEDSDNLVEQLYGETAHPDAGDASERQADPLAALPESNTPELNTPDGMHDEVHDADGQDDPYYILEPVDYVPNTLPPAQLQSLPRYSDYLSSELVDERHDYTWSSQTCAPLSVPNTPEHVRSFKPFKSNNAQVVPDTLEEYPFESHAETDTTIRGERTPIHAESPPRTATLPSTPQPTFRLPTPQTLVPSPCQTSTPLSVNDDNIGMRGGAMFPDGSSSSKKRRMEDFSCRIDSPIDSPKRFDLDHRTLMEETLVDDGLSQVEPKVYIASEGTVNFIAEINKNVHNCSENSSDEAYKEVERKKYEAIKLLETIANGTLNSSPPTPDLLPSPHVPVLVSSRVSQSTKSLMAQCEMRGWVNINRAPSELPNAQFQLPEVDILVMDPVHAGPNGELLVQRTMKYLKALAGGITLVLSPAWLWLCVERDELVDPSMISESEFQTMAIAGCMEDTELGGPKAARDGRSSTLFAGIEFVLMKPRPKSCGTLDSVIDEGDCAFLIFSCGGTIARQSLQVDLLDREEYEAANATGGIMPMNATHGKRRVFLVLSLSHSSPDHSSDQTTLSGPSDIIRMATGLTWLFDAVSQQILPDENDYIIYVSVL